MKKFPAEFADILTPAGIKILEDKPLRLPQFKIPKDRKFGPQKQAPLVRLPGIIKPRIAKGMYDIIDTQFRPFFKPNNKPLNSIKQVDSDFSIRFKVIYYLNRERDKALMQAEKFGLFDMQRSASYLQFMTKVTNLKLQAMPETCQLNMYEHGDHIGMHTDYWANRRGQPIRFVGVHIGMTNKDVASMNFCYPEGQFMSGIFSSVAMGSLTVFVFPFWHATTPLQAKPNKEKTARRYVHLSALSIVGEPALKQQDLKYL